MSGTYEPDWRTCPGETLSEVLEERGLLAADLAASAGLSSEKVRGILHGTGHLTPRDAEALETATGVPARIWDALEASWRRTGTRTR